jgi:gliding motility-associated-like protein
LLQLLRAIFFDSIGMINLNSFRFFTVLFTLLLFAHTCIAQRGKDGNKTIIGNTKVNEYTVLTANASIGDTILQVQSSSLNANNRFSGILAAGDLLMVVQMQGATLGGSFFVGLNNTTFGIPKDSTWGRITAYNNCGNYQFVQVKSILSSTQIIIDCALIHDFTAAGKVQVVRVPRYATLNIPTSTSLTCDAWNGSKGGVLSFEVDGNTTLNGSVSADTCGFRGGEKENLSEFGLNETACDTPSVGAMKGEGIGGFKNAYNYLGGRYCKGAAGNAGGGGDCHNAGGGGGANGGDTALYKAIGIPDISTANNITAFNLETPPISTIISSGGGRGGYSASSNNVSPLTNAPASTVWGGDFRIKNGGFGGRPLDYSTGKIFMGGGGGAGDMNENYGGSGGNGGGLIYALCYGNITGNGSISCNGENGQSTTATSAPLSGNRGQDGAGGGGGGGTIIVECTGNASNIACNAKGGAGGMQTLYAGLFNNKNQAQGPGGGGGGGYIRLSNANMLSNVNGGVNGITNSTAMTNFPSNGATKGAAGSVVINNNLVNIITQNDTICPGNTATLSATVTNITGVNIEWYDAAIGGNLISTGSTFTTAILNNDTDFYVRACPLPYRMKARVIMQNNISNNVSAGLDQQLCNVNSTSLHGTYSLTGSVGIWSAVGNSLVITNANDSNASINNLPLGNYTFVYTVTNGCISNTDTVVLQNDAPNPQTNAGIDQTICGTTVTLNATPFINATWSTSTVGVNISNINSANAVVSNLPAGDHVFVYSFSSNNACPISSDTMQVHVDASPSSANAGIDQTVCSNAATLSTTIPAIGNIQWISLNALNTLTNANGSTCAVSNLQAGANTFVLVISNGVCQSSTDTVIVQLQASVIANAGLDKNTCADTITLHALNATTNGVWTSLGTATVGLPNNPNTQVSNLQSGINLFVFTVTNVNCPTSRDTVQIIKSNAPDAAVAGIDKNTCDSTVVLQANAPVAGIGYWTKVGANNSFIVDADNPITEVQSLQEGTYQFCWTVSRPGCSITKTDTMVVNVYKTDSTMSVMNDTTVTPGVPVTLYASGAAFYAWYPATDLSCSNCAAPVFTGTSDASYLVTLTDVNGCSTTDTLYITTTLLKFVEIADIFSPNAADEKNRTFKIHQGGLKEIDLALYDEFGQLVFSIASSDSFNKQWDGNINGKPAKSGTYVYIYNAYFLDRTTEVRTGKILLSR